jgi:hypothetical protein
MIFKGLGSLANFLDMIPRCQIDSLLHHAQRDITWKFPFHSPLHFAAVSDSPKQDAAGSHSSPVQMQQEDLTPRCMMQQEDFRKNH